MAPTATAPDGVEISYDVSGSGTPELVLVHGWSCDRGYWRGQVGHFSRHHTVVAVDLGGHGDSGTDRTDWSLPAFGGDVVAVVEALGLSRVVLVGHSFGGDVILDAALRLGNRVIALVWVDTYRSLGDVTSPGEVAQFVRQFRADFARAAKAFVGGMFPTTARADLVASIADDIASAPPSIALATLETAQSCEPFVLQALAQVDAPVFAINPGYRPTDIDNLGRHGVQAEVLSDVGHFLMLEDPEQFNRALARIVERLGS